MHLKSKDTLKIAVVGVGRWGKNVVRTIREEMPNVRLTHIVTSNPAVRVKYENELTVFKSWSTLLEHRNEFDCIVAALPPDINFSLAKDVLPLGIPLFIEKPLAMSHNIAQQLLDLAKQHNSIIQVNHIDLYNPAVNEIQSRLDNSNIHIKGAIGAAYPHHAVMTPLWEYSPHFIAAALTIISGSLISLKANYLPIPEDLKDDEKREVVKLKLSFSDGSHAEICAGNGMPEKTRWLHIQQNQNQYLFKDRAEVPLTINGQKINIDTRLPLTKSLLHFADKVNNQDTDLQDFISAIEVIKILELADKSLAQGQPIKL
ncbi:Gfo/Idh/MocA family oxidoreductase [Pseudoalteromonas luteoviolacea]|uniref:Gfo/Idh/MocA family protein n=1 Tax=Pseudoalteromonas luteoviolacea TaxID=43657 RepID=UPI001EED0C92|nr:Gfo/Idh/MocA family oxidoreductase [Pseudoalteromonas luteoviolacea]MCF6440348.1 Gfo/Idh/MocA family oxidoreductase [Pseudoalteromonas luteoviolacea]